MFEVTYWVVLAAVNALSVTLFLRSRNAPADSRSRAAARLRGAAKLSIGFAILGIAGIGIKWFGAVGGESVDPSQRAVILADPGSSPSLLWCVAILASAIVPSLIALAVREWKTRQRG
jgi:hypothetical protein